MQPEETEAYMDYPVGYEWCVLQYELTVLPHYRSSYIAQRGGRKTIERGEHFVEIYPKSYRPDDTPYGHLVFALKYEGIHLGILEEVLGGLDKSELERWVLSKRTGVYNRKLWFLFEWLIGPLDLEDLSTANYVDLLDPDKYYTAESRPSRRHRVNENLLGDRRFCPFVRRTQRLDHFENVPFADEIEGLLDKHDEALVVRALNQLYIAETRSSFGIEDDKPGKEKETRFVESLKLAGKEDFLDGRRLADLLPIIHGNAPKPTTGSVYRSTMEYVGSGGLYENVVHLVPARPEDLDELMSGLFDCARKMISAKLHPVIIAAVIAFGFVFIHPFKDGNGRLHRFLIHHILSKQGFVRVGLMLPVSATMYSQPEAYQRTLNRFSGPAMQHCLNECYTLDSDGYMTVHMETARFFRHIDFTGIAEDLFGFVEQTIRTEFVKQLDFLKRYEIAMTDLEKVIDGLSHRELDLFVKLINQDGRLSKRKREKFFSELSEPQIESMVEAVRNAFEPDE